ncbi:homoserine kinase [Sphingosinicella rhizophila]|uniref:Homoserine kinase n=1 Tax=Sphingosinicella rhizophila TaxID=3050082 RepID=A0ABU3QBB3_9SPHN|nr:homoserine kinase [Sphingosinicella sp. GR2756]MDT9600681.1 homoserine kinase [Sphingosinicella sp. GR2756]
MIDKATAFAPATVANVAVGFDILGHAVQAIGDTVTATRSAEPGVRIRSITGTAEDLPLEAARNTAGRAVMTLWEKAGMDGGVELEIVKGIPLKSGLGGSAASAVGGVVAANALLPSPLDKLDLLRCAMTGEEVASGSVHVDNISPCLFGGLVLTVGIDDPRIKQIPVPPGVHCVLIHPHMHLATKEARGLLQAAVPMSEFVWQMANLAGFLAGCYSNDLDVIREAFQDVVVEPQRASLIPGFAKVREAAMAAGALGCSISGAGPTVFAWCEEAQAEQAKRDMIACFAAEGLDSDSWISAIEPVGARIIG